MTDHKVVPCRCSHYPHYLGIGQCLDCACCEYRPDEHVYPLGFGPVST